MAKVIDELTIDIKTSLEHGAFKGVDNKEVFEALDKLIELPPFLQSLILTMNVDESVTITTTSLAQKKVK